MSQASEQQNLNRRIARNLAYLISRAEPPWVSERQLAEKAGVSPGTIGNLLRPERRLTTSKPEGHPTLDKLQQVATALGSEVWQLLHPDLPRAIAAEEMFTTLESIQARADDEPALSLSLPSTVRRTRSAPLAPSVHQPTTPYKVSSRRRRT
jgi:transcriptional regulator with XRE-family HTH domain